jgi:phosphate uptake regulator
MELRKVQQTRGGTFFVTLPKEWAIKRGLNKGSFVLTSISSEENLIVNPQYNMVQKPKYIDIKISPYLRREIIGNYLLGYDFIRIKSKNRIALEERKIILETSSRLIGLEIIEENYERIVMQCLLEPSALPPTKVLRREHLITSGMLKDSINALFEGDISLAESVISRDNEVDRLYFLLVRILRTIIQNPNLSEKLELLPIDCLDYRLTASLIESVGDHSSQIAQLVSRLKDNNLGIDVVNQLKNLSNNINEVYIDTLNAFINRSIRLADSIRKIKDSIEINYNILESMSHQLPFSKGQILFSIISLLSLIYEHSVDISDLTTIRKF